MDETTPQTTYDPPASRATAADFTPEQARARLAELQERPGFDTARHIDLFKRAYPASEYPADGRGKRPVATEEVVGSSWEGLTREYGEGTEFDHGIEAAIRRAERAPRSDEDSMRDQARAQEELVRRHGPGVFGRLETINGWLRENRPGWYGRLRQSGAGNNREVIEALLRAEAAYQRHLDIERSIQQHGRGPAGGR
jgi:hypothetical protein